jgi:D-aminopeptidase
MSMRPRTVRATNDVCFSNSGIIEFKEGLFTDPSAVGTVAATSVNVAVPETAAQIRQCVTDAMLKASGDIAVGKMSMQVADHEIQNTVRESVKDHIDSMNSMRETVRQQLSYIHPAISAVCSHMRRPRSLTVSVQELTSIRSTISVGM